MDTLDSPSGIPDAPIDGDESLFPCKGCGEILEEGKAFELGKSLMQPPFLSVAQQDHRGYQPLHVLLQLTDSFSLYSSGQPMAYRLLPMQYLPYPPRFRRKSPPPRRWLSNLQQLYV